MTLRSAAVVTVGLLLAASVGGCRSRAEVLFRPGVAYAYSAEGADPAVTLSADRTAVSVGDTVTVTSTVSVPATETQTAQQVVWKYQLPTGFALVSATGPKAVASQATATWTNPDGSRGTATSNAVVVVVLGAALSLTPDADRWVTVPCGDVRPGEQRAVALTLKYTG
jgi:uncharacterized repeat protein (TIGR01451 family)